MGWEDRDISGGQALTRSRIMEVGWRFTGYQAIVDEDYHVTMTKSSHDTTHRYLEAHLTRSTSEGLP